MEARWTSELMNKASPALRMLWTQMAHVFGRHILDHTDDKHSAQWAVLNLPTGTGKTQGTMLYCAMMADVPYVHHPGVLLVVPRIEDADSIAANINGLSNRTDYATSYHSKKGQLVARDNLADFPVLVITHSAYHIAMQRYDAHAFNQTWPALNEWQSTGRRLVVVDEAPTLVDTAHIGLDELRQTLGALPQTVRDDHPVACKILSDLVATAESAAGDGTCSERLLPRMRPAEGGKVDFSALMKSMRFVRFDEQSGTPDTTANQRLYATHCDRLKAVQNLMDGDMYYARVQGKITLHFARLAVPEGFKGAVVLDATASVNVMWELFDRATVLPRVKGVRSYKVVTLHVNRGQNLGKGYLTKHTDRVLLPVMDDLNVRLAGRDVFFATHKSIEQQVLSVPTTFNRAVGTYGSIDGSNTWKTCDTAVILGIRSMPDTWTANMYQGFQGMQDTDWFQSKRRPFGDHEDIRSSLKLGQTRVELIQAINRVRCRTVNDAEGNCPKTDVYVLLPEGAVGDYLLKGIVDSMDGVVVEPWVVEGFESNTVRRGRPSGTGGAFDRLKQALTDMLPGTISKTKLAELTGTSEATMKRFIACIKEQTETLLSGISYVVEGKGRSAKSYFVKA
jgi:hypothetical protein